MGQDKWMGRTVYTDKEDAEMQWGRIKWMGRIVYTDKEDAEMQ